MSRYTEYDGDGEGPPAEFWQKRLELALAGKRGKKALTELKEAILALPEKRLIEGALCNVKLAREIPPTKPESLPMPERRDWRDPNWQAYQKREDDREQYDQLHKVVEQGVGVCAMGAFLWHRNVKEGMDPQQAFEALPALADYDDSDDQLDATARLAKDAGMVYALAWEIAYYNDETYRGLTPEQRYDRFLVQIDKWLALPLPVKPAPRVKRRRQRVAAYMPPPAGVQGALL